MSIGEQRANVSKHSHMYVLLVLNSHAFVCFVSLDPFPLSSCFAIHNDPANGYGYAYKECLCFLRNGRILGDNWDDPEY